MAWRLAHRTLGWFIQPSGCTTIQSLPSVSSIQLGAQSSFLSWTEEMAPSRSASDWPLPYSLYLLLPQPGSSSPASRSHQIPPAAHASGHLHHLLFQTTPPSILKTPSTPFLLSSLCSHRCNHLRGAHFAPMSCPPPPTPRNESHTRSEWAVLTLRECEARALLEKWARTRVCCVLWDFRWECF